MLVELNPDYRLVIWDGGLSSERLSLVSEYKAQRAQMPEDLRQQMDDLVELTKALGFASLCIEGVEADDLIASYAKAAEKSEIECIIATNDKDLFQLVSDHILIYAPQKDGFALQGREEVIKKWGVEPESLALLIALMGDSSDNLPGVPGIGPKTAAAWVRKYITLENIAQHLAQIGTPAQRSALTAAWEQVKKNILMVQLQTSLPLPLKWDQLHLKPDYNKQLELFDRWEFKSMKAQTLLAKNPQGNLDL
jgi:DNA polymerase-1